MAVERICERTGSETLVVLMERILAQLGPTAIEKLAELPAGRGPLVSDDPERDYVNGQTGELYTHHRIPGSPYYVVTHSSTPEKANIIEKALMRVGIPPFLFNITVD